MKKAISLLLMMTMFIGSTGAKVRMPSIFTDNMVLQQQSEVNIWGEASPDKNVTIITSWNGATYTAKAGADGKWKAVLSTPKAGGPYSISIADGKKPLVLENVLIGEVWLCSGQSNMEMQIEGWGKVYNWEQEKADAKNYPNIRLLQASRNTRNHPLDELAVDNGGWMVCNPDNVADFSAAAYFFGRNLTDSLNVPIGLINSSWGGTIAEAWTSQESLQMMPYFHRHLSELDQWSGTEAEREEIFNRKMADFIEKEAAESQDSDKAFENGRAVWATVGYDDSGWMDIQAPLFYQNQDMGYSRNETMGYSWLRKTVDIPSSWEGQDLQLCVGVVDDADYTYFNGVEVGHCIGWDQRKYTVPADLVKGGKAVVSIRVIDTGGFGGVVDGEPEHMYLANSKGEKIPLAGTWKFRMSLHVDFTSDKDMPVENFTGPNFPTLLYNAMINPLVDYRIAGAIWYQGESNADRPDQYNELMPLMINDWRCKWGYDFPFYLAQLANFREVQTGPVESDWAELREAQFRTLNLENTGMAVLIDIGDADDIHPKNKQEVGRRLALYALAQNYGQNIAYSGPLYDGYRLEDGEVRISFTNTDNGLRAGAEGKDSELTGFYIAGPDRVFHDAEVRIEGNTIVVSSDEVEFPVAVRYGWADNPRCNLYNGAGLPASPFRTDTWKK